MKSTDEDRMKSFEMKAFRQILRVKWMDKRTNDRVLRKAGTGPFLLQSVKKRKLSYYGHVLRQEENCTEKEIMKGATSGQRRRGRPRTRWQDNITKWTGLTGDRLLRWSVEDRRQWRKIIYEAANFRIEDGWRYKVQVLKSPLHGWRFSLVVTRWSRSTQLFYAGPG